MPHSTLVSLLSNLASLVIPLFAHRFSSIGSLYFGPAPESAPSPPPSAWTSSVPTPTVTKTKFNFPLMPLLTPRNSSSASLPKLSRMPTNAGSSTHSDFHLGQIISWPFFGSNRGDLVHPTEIDRGPWSTTHEYYLACATREINGVLRENEGKSAPHKLHLDPDEIRASRHHHLQAVPGDRSDESDEYDKEESEEEWEGPGDTIYRDYRRMQRSTFLVAHLAQREEAARDEMARWIRMMDRLSQGVRFGIEDPGGGGGAEEFGLDCHDLSLENIFVDPNDHSKITCIIDWESTTVRPLWACAHPPSFLQSSPFTARLFREAVSRLVDRLPQSLAKNAAKTSYADLATLVAEWRHYETAGAPLRLCHRCVEWDGWEEGLVESIMGPEDQEDEWIKEVQAEVDNFIRTTHSAAASPNPDLSAMASRVGVNGGFFSGEGESSDGDDEIPGTRASVGDIMKPNGVSRKKPKKKSSAVVGKMTALAAAEESKKERLLDGTGDVCGGRGGELGRRLEALLTINGNGDGSVRRGDWPGWENEAYEAEAE